MLYKNDVIWELSRFPNDLKELKEHFHNRFPVKVVYPKERIIKSRLPHNRLPDKPNSISFDLKSVVKTKTGAEVWRYAEEIVIDSKGNKRYIPKKFRFNGTRYLQENDIELIYFLYAKSEYCQGGLNKGRIVKFTFEDLIGEAEKKAERKAMELKIGRLIFDEDMALPEEKLRAVASAFFIRNVDQYVFSELKVILDQKIARTKNGEKRFLEMVQNDGELNNRVAIQNAIDRKIIFFDTGRNKWFWKVSDGSLGKLICSVPPSKNFNEVLFDLYVGDNSFREDIQASLIESKPKKVGRKVKMGDNVDEEEN
jgi:hypothetical protein